MTVEFQNFEFSYKNAKGKPVFAPTGKLRALAAKLISDVSHRVEFPDYYYHFLKGGHVAALHAHRGNQFFAKLDISNFFYSVGRNRLKQVLKSIDVGSPEHFARWSTVKNPYLKPKYSLPYGFPQSPLLASLVLKASKLGSAIEALPNHITRSIYLDDIAISGDDLGALQAAFLDLKEASLSAGFALNEAKTTAPEVSINIFNCDLKNGATNVRLDRIQEFHKQAVTEAGAIAFENYVKSVEHGNTCCDKCLF